MGARFVRIRARAHGSDLEKGGIGQHQRRLFCGESSGLTASGRKQIRLEKTNSRLKAVTLNISQRQLTGSLVNLQQPDMRVGGAQGCNQTDSASPGSNIQNEATRLRGGQRR
jgi:hypothetical protein